MKKGKLYKSNMGGLVVFCTAILDDEFFSGVVVDSGSTGMKVGFVDYEGNRFLQKSFEEYAPTQALEDDCNATVKNGQVLIESGTKYYKHEFEGFVRYGKHVEDGRATIITLCCNGDTKIFHIGERPCPDISGCVKEIDEIEFTNAYNKALNNLLL